MRIADEMRAKDNQSPWSRDVDRARDKSDINASQSGVNREDLFSEEAFSHPDFCSSKLPEFTAERHANIFESENKKLQ